MWPSFYLRRHGDRRDWHKVLVTSREIRSPDGHMGGECLVLVGSSVKILESSTSHQARLATGCCSSEVELSSCMAGSFGPDHCLSSKSGFLVVLKVP